MRDGETKAQHATKVVFILVLLMMAKFPDLTLRAEIRISTHHRWEYATAALRSYYLGIQRTSRIVVVPWSYRGRTVVV